MTTSLVPARSRAQIVLKNVSVSRAATPVLTEVDLTVTPTSRLAVVGENGRGKSTLLHVLAQTLAPTSGEVTRIGTLALAEQEMSTEDDRTVGELVAEALADSLAALQELDDASAALAGIEGLPGATADVDASTETEGATADRYAQALERAIALDAWDSERRVRVALESLGAETDWSRKLSNLSVGQRYRVRLACLLGADDDFLLLDEPTNHLDASALDFFTARLKERKGAVVLVSHDRALLSDVATTFIDLDPTPDDKPRLYGGGYEGYLEGRRVEREKWEQQYTRQESERVKLLDDLSAAQNRLVSAWRPEKGTGKHQRATRAGGHVQSVHRRQAVLDAHAVTMPAPPQPFAFPKLSARRGAILVSAQGVTVVQRLRESATLTIAGGTHLLVTGPNGAGKSTLLQVLAGDLAPTTGRVQHSSAARIALLAQESQLPPGRTARACYELHLERLIASGRLSPDHSISLTSLGLLRSSEMNKRVGDLSMGQQRRLNLAIVVASQPNLLLLDEPTNHLSMALVDELTEALRATDAAVVLSSHDRQLLRDFESWERLQLGAVPPANTQPVTEAGLGVVA